MKTVTIDPGSGFCGGVIRAIESAENALKNGGTLYSLGDIVHNEAELARLASEGLVTIDKDDLGQMSSPVPSGTQLLIRAHGEPPQTYARAKELGFEVIDCTCPVVLSIQSRIKDAAQRLHSRTPEGQVVIFGKEGHAEVLGLLGHAGPDAVVVESPSKMKEKIEAMRIHTDRPIEIFSQTTMSPSGYSDACAILMDAMKEGGLLTIHDTICRQVATRHRDLAVFAGANDVVVFVSGKLSSNGAVLCELCKSVNIRTYHISSVAELGACWFREDDRVGVCGATSTPGWLLKQVADAIRDLQ